MKVTSNGELWISLPLSSSEIQEKCFLFGRCVMRSLSMISYAGNLLFEVLGLLLAVLKCCYIVLVSLEYKID